MDGIAAAGSATSGLKKTTAMQTVANLDINRTESHQAPGFILLLDFLDDGSGKNFDFIRGYGAGFGRGF